MPPAMAPVFEELFLLAPVTPPEEPAGFAEELDEPGATVKVLVE